MKDKLKRNIALIIMAVLGVGMAVVAFYYYAVTVVAWWLPFAAGAVAGLAAMFGLRGLRSVLVGVYGAVAAWVALFLFGLCAGSALLLWGNSAFADSGSVHQEMATVESKHSEEHQGGRYVRGHYVRSGRKYRTYHLKLRFDDGSVKDVQVQLSEYNRIRTGSKREYTLAKGAFGLPVIKR